MYLDYWSLERSPFDAVPDSRSFFATHLHEQALAAISYAACEGGEPVLITGPAGCGKTLLLRALRRQLPPENYQVVFVPELSGADVGMLRRVAYYLARIVPADTAAAMDVISQAADEAERDERSLVVMLDDWPVEAPTQTIEELRWLLNLDVENGRSCVLLTSEPLDPQSCWPVWLRQRLMTTAVLEPLEHDQIPEYLEHRLCRAGHTSGTIFTTPAATAVAEWSHGIPRLVNRLAHLALQVACLQLAKSVEEDAVHQAIQRLASFEPSVATQPEYVGAQM